MRSMSFSPPAITVSVAYPNVAPDSMETLVTRPIENAVSRVAGIQQINSTSALGVSTVTAQFYYGTNIDTASVDVQQQVDRIRNQVGDRPMYLSIDIDVLDPAHAPGTGTPELGGMTSRELLAVVHGLSGLNLVGADVVEVSPPFDHAEVTSLAAATVAYKMIGLLGLSRSAVKPGKPSASRA